MDLIADILLIAGAVGAAFYCIVLSRRLSRFTNLDKGVGGAIAVLSAQVDDMTKALTKAQGSANDSNTSLAALTGRAEEVAKRLELLVASMHDLPTTDIAADTQDNVAEPRQSPDPGLKLAFSRAQKDGGSDETESLFRSQRRLFREAAE